MQLSFHLAFVSLFGFCLTDTSIHNLTLTASKCEGKEKTSSLLDVSRELINKAKEAYPNCVDDDSNCGQKEKSFAFLDVAMDVISDAKNDYPICPETECPIQVERPADCSDILRSGKKESGVYTIWLRSRIFNGKSLSVYCDMDTDGGGWTVIQRRGRFSTPKDYFYKDWDSYKNGFGNLEEEFWIGNDNLFAISNQANYRILFNLKNAAGKAGYAEYSTFWIEDESAGYKLHIAGYKGNVGDSMAYHDKKIFSTRNRGGGRNCASICRGAWWYGPNCAFANLNGLYQPGVISNAGITWYFWTNSDLALSGVEIKLRS